MIQNSPSIFKRKRQYPERNPTVRIRETQRYRSIVVLWFGTRWRWKRKEKRKKKGNLDKTVTPVTLESTNCHNVMIDISLHYARLHSNETIVKKFYGIYNTAQFKLEWEEIS